MKKIPYVNLKKQWIKEKKIILPLIDKALTSGNWVGGDEIKKFENNIKKYLNVKYVVPVNSGTDALTIGLKLLGIKKGDEVITPSNSFVASTAAIVHLGAKPVFADVLVVVVFVFGFDAVIEFSPSAYPKSKNLSLSYCSDKVSLS